MSARKATGNPETDTPKDPRSDLDTKFHLASLFEQTDNAAARAARQRFGEDYSSVPALRHILSGLAELAGSGISVRDSGFGPLVSILEEHHGQEGTWEPILRQIEDQFFATAESLPYWERRIEEGVAKWRSLKATEELWHALMNGHTSSERIEMARRVYEVTLHGDAEARRRIATIDSLIGNYAESVSAPKFRKLRTGLWSLDDATDGIAPGEVLTVVARPQVGKSALACQILVNGAASGVPAVYFSLEMPQEQALERLLQTAFGFTRRQVEEFGKKGFHGLSSAQLAALESIRSCIAIVDRGKSSVADLDSSIYEATATLARAPRLAVVDYLGLMGSGARNLPLYQRVSEAAIDLKSFSKRHRVALILLSQAGRDQDEARSEGAAPLGLDAARDSGQVEEAADFLVTLWRPELRSNLSPEERADKRGQLKGALVKNRRGPLPRLHFQLDAPTLRIRDVTAGGPA